MNRTDIINKLIRAFGYKRYLEIGVGDPENNFNQINVHFKLGIDPNVDNVNVLKITSDEYFRQLTKKYDIIFVDGLHHNDQVWRDIWNSHCMLNEGGAIVVHDCSPFNYKSQIVPQPPDVIFWNGDVWKAWLSARSYLKNHFFMFVVNTDCGVGVMIQGKQIISSNFELTPEMSDYNYFEQHREELLNLVSELDFLQL